MFANHLFYEKDATGLWLQDSYILALLTREHSKYLAILQDGSVAWSLHLKVFKMRIHIAK